MARLSKSGHGNPSNDLWINPKSNFSRESGVSEWEGHVEIPDDSRKRKFADLALDLKKSRLKKPGLKKPGLKRAKRAAMVRVT